MHWTKTKPIILKREGGTSGRSRALVQYLYASGVNKCPANYKSPESPRPRLGEVGFFEKSTQLGKQHTLINQFLLASNMAESIYNNYPPDLSPAQQKFLVTSVKDWAIQNGLAVRPSPAIIPTGVDSNGVLATNAPVTLFPSPFPRVCFEEATALQEIYNELYAMITCNEEWLGNIVEG